MNNDTTAKGIIAVIYRDSLGIDFSNRGISAQVTEVTVIGPALTRYSPHPRNGQRSSSWHMRDLMASLSTPCP